MEVKGEAERLSSAYQIASAKIDSRDNIIRELEETVRRISEARSLADVELKRLNDIISKGTMDNSILSNKVRELEHIVSLGTSHHRDVSSGINKIHEALLSPGDSITNHLNIINDNSNNVNSAVSAMQDDTSDIRRVVNSISANNSLHVVHPTPFATPLASPRGPGPWHYSPCEGWEKSTGKTMV